MIIEIISTDDGAPHSSWITTPGTSVAAEKNHCSTGKENIIRSVIDSPGMDERDQQYLTLGDWRQRNEMLSLARKEKERRRQGQELARWRNAQEERYTQQCLMICKKEIEEKKLALQRVKEQIEYDKIEKDLDLKSKNRLLEERFAREKGTEVKIVFQLHNCQIMYVI